MSIQVMYFRKTNFIFISRLDHSDIRKGIIDVISDEKMAKMAKYRVYIPASLDVKEYSDIFNVTV